MWGRETPRGPWSLVRMSVIFFFFFKEIFLQLSFYSSHLHHMLHVSIAAICHVASRPVSSYKRYSFLLYSSFLNVFWSDFTFMIFEAACLKCSSRARLRLHVVHGWPLGRVRWRGLVCILVRSSSMVVGGPCGRILPLQGGVHGCSVAHRQRRVVFCNGNLERGRKNQCV